MNSNSLEYQHFFPFLFAVFRLYLLKTNFYITPPFHTKLHLTRKNPSVQLRILFVKTLPSLHCRELHFCQLRGKKKRAGFVAFWGGCSAVYLFVCFGVEAVVGFIFTWSLPYAGAQKKNCI